MTVSDKHIAGIEYNSINRELVIYFMSGSKFVYEGVPYGRYLEILESPNRTDTFNNRIKDVFNFKRIY